MAGICYLDGRSVSEETIHTVRDALAWFGPERTGCWRDGSTALAGLVRPFTPEDRYETQPLAPEGSPFALVSVARLDNRDALCRLFGIDDARRATTPDGVLLLKAYERWGDRCPEHLLGAFSFVVWDARHRRLFGARDVAGSYPLFYVHRPGRLFAFATDVGGLHALPEVPRALDELSIAQHLAGPALRSGATRYAGISQLPTAHCFTLTPEAFTLRRYWKLEPGRQQIRFRRDEEYVEAFRELFDEAVRCRLRSLHPVAAHLSGGLDSSSVAATAAALLGPETLHAYSLRPLEGYRAGYQRRNAKSDDSALVETAARRYANIDLHFVTAEGWTPLTHLDRAFRWGATDAAAFNRIWWDAILEDAAARGCGVLLTGQAGNLTVSSVGQGYMAEWFLQGRWVALAREIRLLRQTTGRSSARLLRSDVFRFLLPDVVGTLRNVDTMRRMLPTRMLRHSFAEETGLLKRLRAAGTAPEYRGFTHPRDAIVRKADVVGQHAERDYAFRCGLGVDLRDPTADRRVAEFCLSIPLSQFARGGRDRLLIRRAMEGRLPPDLLGRTDRGSQAPDWPARLQAARADIYQELQLLESVDLARRALDLPGMRAMMDRFSPETTPLHDVTPYQWLLSALFTGRFIRLFEQTPD